MLKSGIFKKIAYFKEIPGFEGPPRKYWFSSNFVKKTGFFWTVRYSLSAKFNRFFIILGGSAWRDRKNRVFQRTPKTTIFGGFLGFSLISIIVKNVVFSWFSSKLWISRKIVIFHIFRLFSREEVDHRIFEFYNAVIYVNLMIFASRFRSFCCLFSYIL